MRLAPILFGLAALFALIAHAQTKATPEKYCGSGDKSPECNLQRGKANTARSQQELDELLRKNQEGEDKNKAAEREQQRLRTVKEKDCNSRTQRCN